eukprot:gene12684-15915_t
MPHQFLEESPDLGQVTQASKDSILRHLQRIGFTSNAVDRQELQRVLAAVEVATARVERAFLVAFEADVLPEVQRFQLNQMARRQSHSSDRLGVQDDQHSGSLPMGVQRNSLMEGSMPQPFMYEEGNGSMPNMRMGTGSGPLGPAIFDPSLSMDNVNLSRQMNQGPEMSMLDMSMGAGQGMPYGGMGDPTGQISLQEQLVQQMGYMNGMNDMSGEVDSRSHVSQSVTSLSDLLMDKCQLAQYQNGLMGSRENSGPINMRAKHQQQLANNVQFYSGPVPQADYSIDGNEMLLAGPGPMSQTLLSINEMGGTSPLLLYSLPMNVQQKIFSLCRAAPSIKNRPTPLLISYCPTESPLFLIASNKASTMEQNLTSAAL